MIHIDEVTLLHYFNLDALDRFCQVLMSSSEPFGGKLVVLSGDFRQILPVVPSGTRARIVLAAVKSSQLWPLCTTLKLTENMRVQRLIELNPTPENRDRLNAYSSWLLQMGNGTLASPLNPQDNIIQIPQHMVCNSVEEMINNVYDNFADNYNNIEYIRARAILTAKNSTVDHLNEEIVRRLPGNTVISESIDTVVDEDTATNYPVELLNSIDISGMPPHILKLKKDCVIILMRNLNVKKGHCNGTRYIVLSVSENIIVAKKLHWKNDVNDIIVISKVPLHTSENDFPFIMRRLQWPIRVAYVMTFNKSQGQSIDKYGLMLPQSVFSHGQLYVGFSRCGDPDNIYVWADQMEFREMGLPEGHYYTRNVVYPEVLG